MCQKVRTLVGPLLVLGAVPWGSSSERATPGQGDLGAIGWVLGTNTGADPDMETEDVVGKERLEEMAKWHREAPKRTCLGHLRRLLPARLHIGRGVRRWNLAPSAWGNPFKVSAHGRARCLELYRNQMRNEDVLMSQLPSLGGRTLACHFFPSEACHADVIFAAFKEAVAKHPILGLPLDATDLRRAAQRRQAPGQGEDPDTMADADIDGAGLCSLETDVFLPTTLRRVSSRSSTLLWRTPSLSGASRS